ncbi:MAG: tetratricopeptide repeat protein [Gallionella sp.]
MNMNNCFCRYTAVFAGALLLIASPAVHADDIQDANKLFRQKQYGQAMDKVNGVLSGKPKDAPARFLKGLILTEQGRAVDAIKTFQALTEDYPELPEPYNNLAVLYDSQGQYDKAKQALEKAIRTHPSYSTAHENLGDIYAKMASQAYDRALQLDHSNTTTKTKLAMIQDLFSASARAKFPASGKAAADIVGAGKPQAASVPPAPLPPSDAIPASVAAAHARTSAAQAAAKANAPGKPAASASADNSAEVLKAVNAWAAAWSARDVKKYLSFYAADFKTPGGEKRADWEAARNERISNAQSIQVGISNATVNFSDSNHAAVKFRQSYQAKHLKTSGNKTLLMVKSGGNWLILEERAK